MPQHKYLAFISYNHSDEQIAAWLQRQLEKFKIPSALRRNKDENSLSVFRDMTDGNKSGGILTQVICDNLDISEYLIVICSPRSAKSDLVNLEVEHFKASGKENKIIPVIIEGVPNPKDSEIKCYPPALDEKIRGVIFSKSNKKEIQEQSVIGIIATILGVETEQLRNRHREQKLKDQTRYITIGASIFAVVAGVFMWLTFQLSEQKQQIQAKMVEANLNLSQAKIEQAKKLMSEYDYLGAQVLLTEALQFNAFHLPNQYKCDKVSSLRTFAMEILSQNLSCLYECKLKGKVVLYQELNIGNTIYDIAFLPLKEKAILFSDSVRDIINSNLNKGKAILFRTSDSTYMYSITSEEADRIFFRSKKISNIRRNPSIKDPFSAYYYIEDKYAAYGVAYSPDKKIKVSMFTDEKAQLINDEVINSFSCTKYPKLYAVNAISFSHDGSLFASGCEDGFLKIWKLYPDKIQKQSIPEVEDIIVDTSQSDLTVFLSTGDSIMKFIKNKDVFSPHTLSYDDHVNSITISKDGLFYLVSGWKSLKLYDNNGKIVANSNDESTDFECAGMSFDNKIIATSNGFFVSLWIVENDKIKPLLENFSEGQIISFSPTENTLAIQTHHKVKLYDLNKKEYIDSINSKHPDLGFSNHELKFSPDGKHIVFLGENNYLWFYNINERKLYAPFEKYEHTIGYYGKVDFSKTGRYLLTTKLEESFHNKDGTRADLRCIVNLWSLDIDIPLCSISLPSFISIGFSPDEKYFIVVANNNEINIYPLLEELWTENPKILYEKAKKQAGIK